MDKDLLEQASKAIAEKVTESVTEKVISEASGKIVEKTVESVMAKLSSEKNLFGSSKEDKEAEKASDAAKFLKAKVFGDRETMKSLNTGTATDGTELVPEYYQSTIVRIAKEYGLARRKGRVVPVQGKTYWPTLTDISAYKIGERGRITAGKPVTGQFILDPEKLAVVVPMSRELLQDANIDVVNAIAALAAEAFAKLEDDMAFGIGASSAGEGIFKKNGVPSKTLTGTAFSDATFEELLEATELLDESVVNSAEWVFSRSVFNILRKKRFEISSDKQEFIFGAPSQDAPATLWDLVYNLHRSMPKLADSAADTNFIALANFNDLFIGDRQEMTMDITTEATIVDTDGSTTRYLFQDDMVGIRFIQRLDIDLANHTKSFARVKTAAAGS